MTGPEGRTLGSSHSFSMAHHVLEFLNEPMGQRERPAIPAGLQDSEPAIEP
jgi:hypothetical protein